MVQNYHNLWNFPNEESNGATITIICKLNNSIASSCFCCYGYMSSPLFLVQQGLPSMDTFLGVVECSLLGISVILSRSACLLLCYIMFLSLSFLLPDSGYLPRGCVCVCVCVHTHTFPRGWLYVSPSVCVNVYGILTATAALPRERLYTLKPVW